MTINLKKNNVENKNYKGFLSKENIYRERERELEKE